MSNGFTSYHAKFLAYELTRKRPTNDLGKLTASLQDAKVDLNPHQVDAALFAFQSPLSKGAILADEVGLGKTIEAGIILSQKWAERKRKLLIIAPANLRKQWNQELIDKFYLPSYIMETSSFNAEIAKGNLNPFLKDEIIICSYHFAKSKDPYLRSVQWDLVIIDEAHRLRNVYKPNNKIANSIKNALSHAPKVLLTATPLQNSILELFGLVSIIDEYTFGDVKSFKTQFTRLADAENFDDLKARLSPICKRTLRRQVLEYINYTNRIAIVEEFFPSDKEMELYDLVSEYLRKPKLYALPASQRALMTLILRKLLASSTYAISGTFDTLITKLELAIKKEENPEAFEVLENYESYDELQDEWDDEDDEEGGKLKKYKEPWTHEEIEEAKVEVDELKEFKALAKSIDKNSKGEKLLTALKKGFEKLAELGANRKALIFTESTRTQTYIKEILEQNGYAGEIILFNGSNADPKQREVYQKWLKKYAGTDRITGSKTADMRQAIVDNFTNDATIMIATEAAAEGINLQFCSLVVNYDLPWNPQRIEQRIGRCHRYGQLFDVVVVNFLNKGNAADQRVYQLLDDKFRLFNGVFGVSDEVLGSIESGVDFEKRIGQIYQECRREEDIKAAFDQLQKELEPDIEQNLDSTRRKLLENFDEEVHQKLRFNLEKGRENLSIYEQWLWQITKYFLKDAATFDDKLDTFSLKVNPFPNESIHPGPYKLLRSSSLQKKSEISISDDVNIFRVGHPLAQKIIDECKNVSNGAKTVEFDYSNANKRISVLEELKGKEGFMQVNLLTIDSFESEEHLILAGYDSTGTKIEAEILEKLFGLSGKERDKILIPSDVRSKLLELGVYQKGSILHENMERNSKYFDDEYGKLDKWAEDMKLSLEKEIKDIDAEIKLHKAEARKIIDLQIKVTLQRKIKDLEKKRNEKRKSLFEAQDDVDVKKENLLNQIESRLKQKIREEELFTIKWKVN